MDGIPQNSWSSESCGFDRWEDPFVSSSRLTQWSAGVGGFSRPVTQSRHCDSGGFSGLFTGAVTLTSCR